MKKILHISKGRKPTKIYRQIKKHGYGIEVDNCNTVTHQSDYL